MLLNHISLIYERSYMIPANEGRIEKHSPVSLYSYEGQW
jgi:hypothetical protein